jgi:hypothetical protein
MRMQVLVYQTLVVPAGDVLEAYDSGTSLGYAIEP